MHVDKKMFTCFFRANFISKVIFSGGVLEYITCYQLKVLFSVMAIYVQNSSRSSEKKFPCGPGQPELFLVLYSNEMCYLWKLRLFVT